MQIIVDRHALIRRSAEDYVDFADEKWEEFKLEYDNMW